VIRALGKLGDHSVLKNLIPLLKNSPRATKVEAIKAISHLADESHADTIRNVLLEVKQSEDATIMNSADKAIKEIDARFSSAVIEENVRAGKMADSALASAFVRKLTCMVIS
jgi:HEAT repeat protein